MRLAVPVVLFVVLSLAAPVLAQSPNTATPC
jgi:hypothetical protein